MNNNLLNNVNFIGSTHLDYTKISSNFTLATSNILETRIRDTSNVLAISIRDTSNVLETHISDAKNYNIAYTNNLRNDVNKWIGEETEHITLPLPVDLTHTHITNSNLAGEIRFWVKSASTFPVIIPTGVPDYRTKIDVDGKLKVYYTYDPAINLTWGNGWIDVANQLVGLIASDVNIGISLGGIEAEIIATNLLIDEKFTSLLNDFQSVPFEIEGGYDDAQARYILSNIRNTNFYSSAGNFTSSYTSFVYDILAFLSSGRTAYITTAVNRISFYISQNPAATFFLGIGGGIFAAVVGAMQNLKYTQNIAIELKKQIKNQSNLTEANKEELYASNLNIHIDQTIQYCSNIYNITLAQGFINSNITTSQTIPDIITTKITYNGNTIDNLFSNTSNYAYNLINVVDVYGSAKRFPPKLYDSNSSLTPTTFLSQSCYSQTITINPYTNGYGIGTYTIYTSSYFSLSTYTPMDLFNFNDQVLEAGTHWAANNYTAGNYNKSSYIVSGYTGEFLIIQFPVSVIMTQFRFYNRTGGTFPNRAPGEWKLYGSTDGINFTEITDGSQTTKISTALYPSGYYQKTLTSSIAYSYFGWTINKLAGSDTILNFVELQIFAKEKDTYKSRFINYYDTSQQFSGSLINTGTITNNGLINGNGNITLNGSAVINAPSILQNGLTIENISKNTILSSTPNVSKKYMFQFTCSTSILMPNNITYYKYDIDLRNYTQLKYIPNPNTPYRIFKIKLWMASGYFEYLYQNNKYSVLSYEVYMSNQSQAGGGGMGDTGINIRAFGFPENNDLKSITASQIILVRTPDFNYLSCLSLFNTALVNAVIEDVLH